MPTDVRGPADLRPGDYYEDCSYHPCICIRILAEDGDMEVAGISLVDGSHPRACSVPGCAVRRLTFEEAMRWKFYGPPDAKLEAGRRWWDSFQGHRVRYWPEPTA